MKLAIMFVLLSVNASAEGWSRFGYVGVTSKGASTGKVTTANGATAESTSDDKTGFDIGFGTAYQTNSPFGVAAILDYGLYSNSNNKKDLQASLMIMPKIQYGERIKYWAGVGFGLVYTTLGQTVATSGSLVSKFNDGSFFAPIISPRAGVDIMVSDTIFIGAQISYSTYATTLDGTLSNGAASTTYKENISRHWFGAVVSIGQTFGDNGEHEERAKAPEASK